MGIGHGGGGWRSECHSQPGAPTWHASNHRVQAGLPHPIVEAFCTGPKKHSSIWGFPKIGGALALGVYFGVPLFWENPNF